MSKQKGSRSLVDTIVAAYAVNLKGGMTARLRRLQFLQENSAGRCGYLDRVAHPGAQRTVASGHCARIVASLRGRRLRSEGLSRIRRAMKRFRSVAPARSATGLVTPSAIRQSVPLPRQDGRNQTNQTSHIGHIGHIGQSGPQDMPRPTTQRSGRVTHQAANECHAINRTAICCRGSR